jgi:ribosome biogenesis protein BRX1
MASVYKSLSKSDTPASKEDALSTGPKNRQRVLILSSRGITYRYALSESA